MLFLGYFWLSLKLSLRFLILFGSVRSLRFLLLPPLHFVLWPRRCVCVWRVWCGVVCGAVAPLFCERLLLVSIIHPPRAHTRTERVGARSVLYC